MIFKRLTASAVLATVAISMAAVQPGGVMFGKGMARNAESARVRFDFEVAKTPQMQRPQGRFLFEAVNPQGQTVEAVRGTVIREVGTDGNRGLWQGRAVFRTRVENEMRSIEGHVQVTVIDRKERGNANPETPKDVIRVVFRADSGGRQFTYEGLVVDGDLVVRRPPQN